MKCVERKSPTLGQKPPEGAIVLLAYEEGKPTSLDHWNNKQWVCLDDGSILTRQGDTKTDRDFGSYKLHVEFRVPFMPAARGQGRGNSGVYQHGRYEIQVLDSFGLTENPGEWRSDLRPKGGGRQRLDCRRASGKPTILSSRCRNSTIPANRPRAPSSPYCTMA